ncbi:hypothetical protein HanLR1_Chr00c2662g0852251 [Helianthus annuus]|nr:hypothetical protein HanLR1_Chr00c2662g0852251 [Helianthus annuus]
MQVVVLMAICPFNILYRTNRFFFLTCVWHCLCAPLYLVTLPDFFLADQFTSQVQLLRNVEFYACYYGWGDFKKRDAATCNESNVLNAILRLAWMQTVLDFNEASFLHTNALIAVVASLEIIRRGIWNFFRLENEHLNNVGKFRAVKSVPLPFSYEDKDKDL